MSRSSGISTVRNLYRLRLTLSNGHSLETTFGVRKIEVRGAAFYLNDEPVRLIKTAEPLPALLDNGLEQLREMIARNRDHPCVFSWGVCNETNGQNLLAYAFAKRPYEAAKKLDLRRLATNASNSLQKTPGKDVAGLMDYVMWNEYYESW